MGTTDLTHDNFLLSFVRKSTNENRKKLFYAKDSTHIMSYLTAIFFPIKEKHGQSSLSSPVAQALPVVRQLQCTYLNDKFK